MSDLNVSLLDVRDLKIAFWDNSGHAQTILDGLSFSIETGEIFGLIGESGCGKTLAALAIAGLLPPTAVTQMGSMNFQGQDLRAMAPSSRRRLLGADIGMIFQEPLSALNPMMMIGKQLLDVLRAHGLNQTKKQKQKNKAMILEMLANVGFLSPIRTYNAYPHQLSGGQRQRALIAGCLLLRPSLLIADEPTTALDTVTQAQILDQLRRISRKMNIGVLFISHNLLLVESLCDRVGLIKDGRIVETGRPKAIFTQPKDPYTQSFVRQLCLPKSDRPRHKAADTAGAPLYALSHVSAGYTTSLFSSEPADSTIDDISFSIYPGEIVGIVGKSGCGKTTLARTLTGLLPVRHGDIHELGQVRQKKSLRKRRIGMIFQDPYASLHPHKTIARQLEEPLRVRGIRNKAKRKSRCLRMLENMGLSAETMTAFPHQLSGGQRQRVAIGISLMLSPALIIADEPVSSLDLTVQPQILALLARIHRQKNLSILLISHDLEIVRTMSSRIAVMENGRIVESGPTETVLGNPKHPATKELIRARLIRDINDSSHQSDL